MRLVRGATLAGCLAFLALAAPVPATAGGVYFVKEGDTLFKISRIFDVDVQSISDLNSLDTPDIKPGDRLRIPDPAPAPRPETTQANGPEIAADSAQQPICRDETVYHTVAKGDTLFALARRYSTGVDDLLQLNGLRKRARLSIGQRLLVRHSGPRSHTVARGETLRRIAARYHVAPAEIARLNHLDGERVVVGRRLMIEPCDPYAAAGSAPPPLGDSADPGMRPDDPLAAVAVAAGSPAARNAGGAPAAAPEITDRLIKLARTMLNIPYRFGGTTLRGIDCSAYVQRVFGLLDVQIPRTAREQYGVGARVDREDLAVGDLVFFRTYASFPSHVGIYLGDNLFIHASSVVRKVTIDSIDLPYYRKRFLGARRLVADDAPSLAAAP